MHGTEKPGEMNVAIVAYYGDLTPKPTHLNTFIREVQDILAQQIPRAFTPAYRYSAKQVHATIIGLEGRRIGDQVFSDNYHSLRQEQKLIDLKGLFTWLETTSQLRMQIKIGGFAHARPYPFMSRGLHPYLRSFALRGQIAVAMGWPVMGNHYPLSLESLRHCCMDHNALHKYHAQPQDVDNDFFFVLGRVKRERLTQAEIDDAENLVRIHMANNSVPVTLGPDNVSVVGYTDTSLPLAETCQFTLSEAAQDPGRIVRLYRELGN
jgi:hypothetical protein